ncbi:MULTISPECIES: RNA-binding S4 domain-containing protein [Nesterenkonia]|uniref:Ribosome-associated protein n=1 Tax=Nesterenkonia xinjiangensis TaxID=225327 RepID=A0A7Z0GMR9_9MICC|nr:MULTISPECIES: RNA-binding S4 domain-containing protein [Nesterenkonia]MDZ5076359.1 RNA-binding S4 domain-containing protein [Nesterenkonia sp. HG001]NYJ78851.1 ribosome-associated protein [Nesterenkonia xinjiangensis]
MSADDVEQVPIRDESIRLGQLLKLASVVEDGVMAREVIAAGAVTVDDEVETRRGRQVRRGQVVRLDGEELGLPSARLTPTAE